MLSIQQASFTGSTWSLRSDVSASGRRLVDVQVLGVEKRYSPRRHHVYIISELWSDGSRLVVYRTYRQFRALHKQLKETFPLEAGQFRDEDKVLPKFPNKPSSPVLGRKYSVGRFAFVQKHLQEYCQDLLGLDCKIVLSPLLQGFFAPSDDDLTSSHNSGGHQKTVMIIPTEAPEPEAPRSPSALEISAPLFDLDSYIAVADYKAASKGELSLKMGEACEVIHTTPSGWWLVENTRCEQGWVPASHLVATADTGPPDTQPEVQSTGTSEQADSVPLYVTTRPYTATEEDELSFCAGAVLQVLQRTDDGWWLARYNGQQGFVPAMFLQPYNSPYIHIVTAQDKLSVVNLLAAEKQDQKSTSRNASCSDLGRMSLLGDELSAQRSRNGSDASMGRSDVSSISLPRDGLSDMMSCAGGQVNRNGNDSEGKDIMEKNEKLKTLHKLDLPQITISDADDTKPDCGGKGNSHDDVTLGVNRVPSLPNLTETNHFHPRRRANSDTKQDSPRSPMIPPRPSQQEIIQKCSPLTRRRLLATPCSPTSDSDCSPMEEEAPSTVWADSLEKEYGLGPRNFFKFTSKCYKHDATIPREHKDTFNAAVQDKYTCKVEDNQEDTQGEQSTNTEVSVNTGSEDTFVRNARFWRTLKLKRPEYCEAAEVSM